MGIEEIMTLELDGLSNTISDYCRENYILSYTEKLKSMTYPQDKENIKKLAQRLLDWYLLNNSKIQESKFITNKQEHQKSIELLQSMINQIR